MLTLRAALPQDESSVFCLALDLAMSFRVERAPFSHSFARVLASADMHLAVACASNEVIGYVLGISHPAFYANGNVAWVEEIMVREDHRGKGAGKMLMDHFEAWASSRQCRLVSLATRRAADFYRAIGYVESAAYFRKDLKV
jgi:GNAT superfamily N-acetyltransferase